MRSTNRSLKYRLSAVAVPLALAAAPGSASAAGKVLKASVHADQLPTAATSRA